MAYNDEEYVKKEATKRRLFLALFALLFVIVATLATTYFSGLVGEEPLLARAIIFAELAAFVAVYFVLRRRLDVPGKRR